MNKALLYLLLFIGITLLMTGCGILLAGLIMSQELYSSLGIAKDDVLLYVVMIMGVLWACGTCWLFTHNHYGSFSWGILDNPRRIIIICLSVLLFLNIDVLAFWCHHLIAPFSNDYIHQMELYQAHPFITLLTLVLMYVTVQTVFLSGILRELTTSMRHRWLALLVVSVIVALPNLQEGVVGIMMFAFAIASGMLEGWLYLRSRSIWPAVIGPVVGDYVLWIALGNTPQLWMGITCFVTFPLALWLLHRQLVQN